MIAQSIERLPFDIELIRSRQRAVQAAQPARSEPIERTEKSRSATALTAPLFFAII
jgi:hypothetical protein